MSPITQKSWGIQSGVARVVIDTELRSQDVANASQACRVNTPLKISSSTTPTMSSTPQSRRGSRL